MERARERSENSHRRETADRSRELRPQHAAQRADERRSDPPRRTDPPRGEDRSAGEAPPRREDPPQGAHAAARKDPPRAAEAKGRDPLERSPDEPGETNRKEEAVKVEPGPGLGPEMTAAVASTELALGISDDSEGMSSAAAQGAAAAEVTPAGVPPGEAVREPQGDASETPPAGWHRPAHATGIERATAVAAKDHELPPGLLKVSQDASGSAAAEADLPNAGEKATEVQAPKLPKEAFHAEVGGKPMVDAKAEPTSPALPPSPLQPPSGARSPGIELQPAAPSSLAGQPQGPAAPPVPLAAVPIEIGLKTLAGVNHFEIRLDPAELGRIDVSLEIGESGEVKAHLVVDRVETLHLLQRDAKTLERAFEQAGLKPSEGGVDLTLRDPTGDGRQSNDRRRDDGQPDGRNRHADEPNGREPAPAAPYRAVWRGNTGVDLRI